MDFPDDEIEEYIQIYNLCICGEFTYTFKYDETDDCFKHSRLVFKTIDERGYYEQFYLDFGGDFGKLIPLRIGSKFKFHAGCFGKVFRHTFDRQLTGRRLFNGKPKTTFATDGLNIP